MPDIRVQKESSSSVGWWTVWAVLGGEHACMMRGSVNHVKELHTYFRGLGKQRLVLLKAA